MYYFDKIWIFWKVNQFLLFLLEIIPPIEPIIAHRKDPMTIIIQYGCHRENITPKIK